MMMMLMYQWTYHQPSEKSKMFVREKVGGVALTAHNDVSIHDASRTAHSHTHTHLPILVRWTERTRHSSLVVYQSNRYIRRFFHPSGVCMLCLFSCMDASSDRYQQEYRYEWVTTTAIVTVAAITYNP